MKLLLWCPDADFDSRVTSYLGGTGNLIFRETKASSLVETSRQQAPLLLVLAAVDFDETALSALDSLTVHPETRWTPIIALVADETPHAFRVQLLERGADAVISLDEPAEFVEAQLAAIKRAVLKQASLRMERLTDEQTGFYHQAFLKDQLQVMCRKQLRDGIDFCLLLVELRGSEENVRKTALSLASTVRGADLFGRWEREIFAVLLPSSKTKQALLLSGRFENILESGETQARSALAASEHSEVESDAMIERALTTLDTAWGDSSGFLWEWDSATQQGRPLSAQAH